MGLAVVLFAAGLLTSDPAPFQTLVAEPIGGCDVALQFTPNPVRQSINMNVYWRVTAWLRRNPTRATTTEARWGSHFAGEGGRTLCLTAPASSDTAALYEDLRKLLPKFSVKGRIVLQSRLGSRFETEFPNYSPGDRVPKNNGLRERPPTDKWN